MSDIMEHILARRSIRKFTDEPVDPALIRKLLEAAMAAPSASDRRPWEFVVVRDSEALRRLRRGLPFGRQNAPLAIVVCGNKRRALPGPAQSFWVHDCSAAMENLLLAAHGLGLGAVWVGVQPLAPLRWAVSRVAGHGLVLLHHANEQGAGRSGKRGAEYVVRGSLTPLMLPLALREPGSRSAAFVCVGDELVDHFRGGLPVRLVAGKTINVE